MNNQTRKYIHDDEISFLEGKSYNIKASHEFILYLSAALKRISQGDRINTIKLIEAYLQLVHDLYMIEMRAY